MNLKRLKLAIICVLLAFTTAAFAGHSYHNWVKIKTERGDGNWVICTWKCDGVLGKDDAHTTETSGRGSCPRP